jgi:hypothetical protein
MVKTPPSPITLKALIRTLAVILNETQLKTSLARLS